MKFRTIAAAVAVAVLATGASAASLTINSVTGLWQNPTPGSGISGVNTSSISWGNGSPQSGYDFVGAAPPASVQNDGVEFTLGTFTHRNFPISGTVLESVSLAVTVNVAGYGNILSTFSFAHDETDNGASPCPYSPNNAFGCSDKVTATLNLSSTQSFQIGGVDYIFTIVGFQVGGNTLTSFITQENQTNTALLRGKFIVRPPAQPNEVPLPAAGLLLVGGLGAMTAFRRRKAA